MNDLHLCSVIARHPDERPGKWRTVLTFVGGTDYGRACYLAGLAGDTIHDSTRWPVNWHVEPIPCADQSEGELIRLAREVATELTSC